MRARGGKERSIIAGYYVKNKDYSAAIASETDTAKRETLLSERQNKIDAEGLAGKVASNQAVSQWSGDYRPYSTSAGGATIGRSNMGSAGSFGTGGGYSGTAGGAINIGSLYDAIERSRLEAFEAARQENARRLAAQRSAIEQQYTANVTQAQTDARLTARGSEEKLAALGLNAGGMYAAPTTGYAESTRITADNALKSDLNGLAAAKQTALGAAEDAAMTADTALRTQNATAAASAAQQLASIALSQYNADRSYALQQQSADRNYALSSAAVTGYLGGTPTLDYQKYTASLAQQQAQRESAAQQTAFENAMTRWKTYGYVLPADAATLGVPAGTGTADARYSAAALRLNQIKTAYQTSK